MTPEDSLLTPFMAPVSAPPPRRPDTAAATLSMACVLPSGGPPLSDVVVDFCKMMRCKCYRYKLVTISQVGEILEATQGNGHID